MRAKLSTTADGTYSGYAPPAPIASDLFDHNAGLGEQAQAIPRRSGTHLHRQALQRADRSIQPIAADLRGEGLLHDARNLVSAIGLYCDLLSMPGVLKPEHKQYPEELRLLGTRSRVLIEHLLRSLVTQNLSNQSSDQDSMLLQSPLAESQAALNRRIPAAQPVSRRPQSAERMKPVSLRATVERCSGLLSRVASGRPIEVIYGAAADVPIAISEEAIERILVNLVRNASQALDLQESLASQAASSHLGLGTPIRISVGPLLDRVGRARSWPFLHVRLVIEDSGCGMEQKQLHALLSNRIAEPQGSHGIGFRVVRELVTASKGDLCVASTPGVGTRVQIEWPVAATPTTEKDRALMQRNSELSHTLNPSSMELSHRSLPASSTTVAGRQGVN